MACSNAEHVHNVKLGLRTVTAENLSEYREQRSSSAVRSSRQRKVSQYWAPFIPSLYTGPGMVSGVAVSPPNAKGSAKRLTETLQSVQLTELSSCFNIYT